MAEDEEDQENDEEEEFPEEENIGERVVRKILG